MNLHRINLYNYQEQITLYKQYRLYLLLSIMIVVPIVVNILLFCWIEISLSKQYVVNENLRDELATLDIHMKPAYKVEKQLHFIKDKKELIMNFEKDKNEMINIFQYLESSTPSQIYFTNLDILDKKSSVNFKGVSLSPLYVAQFMDSLRESSSGFQNPILRSNNSLDDDTYVFEINVNINKTFMKISYESED